MMSDIVIIGAGYVGLPNALFFADSGYSVVAVDKNIKIVDEINNGITRINEPDVQDLLKNYVKTGRVRASRRIVEANCYIIAVPTPIREVDKSADLTFVITAIEELCPILKKNDLILLFSTCPVGTTEKIANIIKDLRPDLRLTDNCYENAGDIGLAYTPERVLPGSLLKELRENSKIIGGYTKSCAEKAKTFLSKAYGERMVEAQNARAAELVKLTENAFRDVQIAFVNQLSMISDQLEIDVNSVIELANEHPRVDLLKPGIGVGGHCIPVDPWFLIESHRTLSELSLSARKTNIAKETFVADKIKNAFLASKKSKIMLFGLSYKEDVADFRESPALRIFEKLQTQFENVYAVDPYINIEEHQLKNVSNKIEIDVNLSSFFKVQLVKHNIFSSEDASYDLIF